MMRGPLQVGLLWVVVVTTALAGCLLPAGSRAPGPVAAPEAPSAATPSSVAATPTAPPSDSSLEVAPAYSGVSGATEVGPMPFSQTVSVVVGLAPTDPSALAALVAALYAPGTTAFHQFRTPSELAANFGASPSDVGAARAYFERFGLTVTPSADHLLLTVSGPSVSVAAAFGTTFDVYRAPDGRTFFSHPTPATLPHIAPWTGAYGLGNVSPLVPAEEGVDPVPEDLTPALSCIGLDSVLSPCQVWQAYNYSSLILGGKNGSGIRIAVVDPYSSAESQPDLESDLAEFAADNGLSVGTVNYVYPDVAPGNLNQSTNTGWSAEDALDLEWARGSAPGAAIDMTFSPNPGPGLYEAVDWLVAHQAADVISMSWGEPDVGVFNAYSTPCSEACNASTDGSYGLLSPVLEFAAAEGISVFAASGDCGAADGTSGVSTNFPASDPFVTGVGGTNLTVDAYGDYISETAWSGNSTGAVAPGCQNQGGSGGGYSDFPRPEWQVGLPTGEQQRGVPDVALDAETPVDIIVNGQSGGVEGTSVATPIWAGIAAIADQYAGRALGFLNPTLYAIAAGANYTRDFHAITSGWNGYYAHSGWNPVTGLGSPVVAELIPDLVSPVTEPRSNLTTFVYATPRWGKAPLTVAVRVNATGGSGVYPFEGVYFGNGNASWAVNGTATYTYTEPGVYAVQSYVDDSDANGSVSPPILVVVGGGGALSVTLSASTRTPETNASVLLTATATGGTAPYDYDYFFGDGTYELGSADPNASHVFGARGGYCAEVIVSDSGSPVDGGASSRVALGVGGVSPSNCENDTTPLTITPTPDLGVRDAPADFPSLFSVSGGSTGASGLPPSLAVTSSDPYIAACRCSIFRSVGNYSVTGYANDSENEQAVGRQSVTVAPPLSVSFGAAPAFGPAPLTVNFSARASGGYEANASDTHWTFGDGTGVVGAVASATYSRPGVYVVVAHLSDRGDGNASEAFVIDVAPAGEVLPVTLSAALTPATDVPLGTGVNLTASLTLANGSAAPAAYHWTLGSDSGAFRSSLNWTYSSPSYLLANGSLEATLDALDPENGVSANATFWLPDFGAVEAGGFQPRTDALSLLDKGGPESGSSPLFWTGVVNATGPGTVPEPAWTFGNASVRGLGAAVEHTFYGGRYTVTLAVVDSWGDRATDALPVSVTATLRLTASLSTLSGTAPLNVTFRSNVTGGVGPPYEVRWTFGDGGTATTGNGTHSFLAVGTYNVTLNVSDAAGNRGSMNWTVDVVAAPGSSSGFPYVIFLVVGGAAGAAAAVAAVLLHRRRSAEGGVSP